MTTTKMQRDSAKTKLSSGILNMKFMKKTKEKLEMEQEDNDGRMMYANSITHEMRTGASQYLVIDSRVVCEGLIDGRVSFGGINPDVEQIMREERDKRTAAEEKRNETDISDNEMAKTYSTLVNKIAGKFNKNKRCAAATTPYSKHNKKTRFLKPQDV